MEMEIHPMFNFDLDPGPIDQSVLVWQHEHRSAAIWEDEVPPRELTCRHKLLGMRDWPLEPLVCRQLIEFGLYGVYKVAFIQLDYALITALVERWRPETHTFHLPVGEITITLQDVNILLGLHVDGPAVTGSTKYNWADLCEDLLGRRPGSKDLHGSHVSLGWLRDNFRNLPSDPDEETLKRHTRAFVLALMSGFLYGDKSKHDVALTFLPLLRDFDEVAQLSWGSATLALLYRELCRASKRTVSTICGPLVLLQLWAWERLHVGRPGRLRDVGASYMDGIAGPLPDPLGCRWRSSLSHKENPRGGLDFYRDQFDQQKDDQVIWQPYTPDMLAKLPPICLSGQKIWRTVAPLICFDVVEWHRPDRVLRQFGLHQTIPAPCDNERALHAIDKRGKSEYDWSARHSRHIDLWEARESSIAVGEPEYGPMGYNNPYMEWYRQITRKIISPMKERRPGQFQPTGFAFQLLVQRVAAIYARSKASLEEALTVDTARQTLQDILDVSAGALQLTAPFGSLSNGSSSQAPTPELFPALPPSLPTEMMQKPLSAEVAILHSNKLGATNDVSVATLEVLPPVQAPESEPSLSSSSQKPLSWPSGGKLSFSWICDVMLSFDWSSRNLPPSEFSSVLPISVFDELVLAASRILKKEPNCVKIDSNKAKVVMVGDLHGQLHDLLFLMQDAGFPDDDQFYVFNGNYVDKGAWGLETFLLLLSWKVFLPERVYILRGNHESESCTSVYGFRNEVLTKYGDKGPHVYRKCLDCFQLLPLASLIAGKVFSTHGGLFRSVSNSISGKQERSRKRKRNQKKQTYKSTETENDVESLSLGSLEELSKAKRRVLDPPTEGSNLIPGDILWSNPSKNNGLSLNNERGVGLLWGPDYTTKFLEENDLKLIVRGNEGPDARAKEDGLAQMDEGYSKDHEGLITLFSAPDYPQFQDTEERYNNRGAYIIIQIPEFEEPEIHVFEAVSPRPKVEAYYDFRTSTKSPQNLEHKNSDFVDSPSSALEDKDMVDSAENIESKSTDDSDLMEVDEKGSIDSIIRLESTTDTAIVSGSLVSGSKYTLDSPENLENGFKGATNTKTIAVSEDVPCLVEKLEFSSVPADENLGSRIDKAIEPESLADDLHGVGSGEAIEFRSETAMDPKQVAVDDKHINDTTEESESRSREEMDDAKGVVSTERLEQKTDQKNGDSMERSESMAEEVTDSKPATDIYSVAAVDGAEKLGVSAECTRSEEICSVSAVTVDKDTTECSTDKAIDGAEKLELSASKVNDSVLKASCSEYADAIGPGGETVDDRHKGNSTALSECPTSKLNDSERVESDLKDPVRCTSREARSSQPMAAAHDKDLGEFSDQSENKIKGTSNSEQNESEDKDAGNSDECSKCKTQETVDSESQAALEQDKGEEMGSKTESTPADSIS